MEKDLKGKVAWADLNASFPTPVHEASITLENGKKRKFYLKREGNDEKLFK
jgi:hypothetical protein